MAKTLETKFEIKSWDEKPTRELTSGGKLTRAEATLAGDADGLSSAGIESAMYYRPDGTSSYVSQMYVEGRLDGRSGGFVLQGQGTYDGTTARLEFAVLPGSGTGELAGLSGSARSVSTHGDYPFMPLTLRYELG